MEKEYTPRTNEEISDAIQEFQAQQKAKYARLHAKLAEDAIDQGAINDSSL